MNQQELRWFNNCKKAFYHSDVAYESKSKKNKAFFEICSAIDISATLQKSLNVSLEDWESPQRINNRKKYIEFIDSEIPAVREKIDLYDKTKREMKKYRLSELVYDIRCINIHESENLNVEENVDYHILLDWEMRQESYMGLIFGNKVYLNAEVLWWRLRELLAKFITCIQSVLDFSKGEFSIFCRPPLKSIKN